MYLRSIAIENYRAIREAKVTFDQTTLLIGENDSGRTSVIEALMLMLGATADRFETRLRPLHFHRGAQTLRITLRFQENNPGDWKPPPAILRAVGGGRNARRSFEFEFTATINRGSGATEASWRLAASRRAAAQLESSLELLNWVRELVPVLWLRTGLLVSPEGAAQGTESESDALLNTLALHYRNLITGEAPDLEAELELGAIAASAVIDKYTKLFEGAAPMMGAMAADILRRRAAAAPETRKQGGTGAQKIGMLLLLGAILQLVRRNVLPEGRPLLVLDNPESNLHPMTLASVWSLLERITWQKLITTNSGTLLANAPLSAIRRLTRHDGAVLEWSVPPGVLSREELRRVAYHVRSRRASAMFARCWLLVEGETEFWVMPELARVLGYDFAAEGIVPVEFAQCGLPPLIKLADCLGISWQVLADGDDAGDHYVAAAEEAARGAGQRYAGAGVIQLPDCDIETCFWHNGSDEMIRRIAYPGPGHVKALAKAAIRKAIERTSKPFLALSLIESAAERGRESVPAILKEVIEAAVALARTELNPRRY